MTNNDKAEQEDARNKSLPRLPIYDFDSDTDKFTVRKDDKGHDCFICLAPQKDNEWARNFKKFFNPHGGHLSEYFGYHNPLYYFFVSGQLDDIERFRADNVCTQEIKIYGGKNTQAWKGADVRSYDQTNLGDTGYAKTYIENDHTNKLMQLLALYKPYLCDDKHLSTIISAALKFYEIGWKYDNLKDGRLKPCNDCTNEENKNQYINLKYVAHLLAFAIGARRLPNTANGALKGYDEIEQINLSGNLLNSISKAIETKMAEVLKSKENKNQLTFVQIGEKFKKIREHENTIRTKQQEYKERLLEILENGKNGKYGEDVTEKIEQYFRMTPDAYNSLISSIKGCKLEQVINRLTIKTGVSFYFKYGGTKEVYDYLLTETQRTELDNLAKEVKSATQQKNKLYEEIGSEKFHSQLKELDEIREHTTFFCNHSSKCDLGVLEQILNAICSIFGYKPFKGKNRLDFEKNPFDLINETASSEEKPQMAESDKDNGVILT